MVECVSFTLTTLQSLLQLLDEVKNMVISDDIQQEVAVHTVSFVCVRIPCTCTVIYLLTASTVITSTEKICGY